MRELTTDTEVTTMEDKRCPVLIDGKECGRELTEVAREDKKNSEIRLSSL
jgi:hypothetical protein